MEYIVSLWDPIKPNFEWNKKCSLYTRSFLEIGLRQESCLPPEGSSQLCHQAAEFTLAASPREGIQPSPPVHAHLPAPHHDTLSLPSLRLEPSFPSSWQGQASLRVRLKCRCLKAASPTERVPHAPRHSPAPSDSLFYPEKKKKTRNTAFGHSFCISVPPKASQNVWLGRK